MLNEVFTPVDHSSEIIPSYSISVDGCLSDLGTAPRSLLSWQNKSFISPKLGVDSRSNVMFVRSNGTNRGMLFTDNGQVLDASCTPRYGFGADSFSPKVRRLFGRTLIHEGRYLSVNDVSDIRIDSIQRISEPTIVLGFLDKQFGHFLTEGLARAWALLLSNFKDYKILAWTDSGELMRLHSDALRLLGVDRSRLILARGSLLFDQLVIPERGYRLFGAGSATMAKVWERIRQTATLTTTHSGVSLVYLSRYGNRRRRLDNENEIEDTFRDLGFSIIHPEQMSFDEQVALVGQSDVLAGCYGSQMHLSMFLRPGSKKIVLAAANFVFPDEAIIASITQTKTAFLIAANSDGDMDASDAKWYIDPEMVRLGVIDVI